MKVLIFFLLLGTTLGLAYGADVADDRSAIEATCGILAFFFGAGTVISGIALLDEYL